MSAFALLFIVSSGAACQSRKFAIFSLNHQPMWRLDLTISSVQANLDNLFPLSNLASFIAKISASLVT
jgi:hypothetical protein